MDDMLFYLISSILFLAIIRESMGIFFIRKDVPCFLSVMAWTIFCAIEIIGITFITIPIFTVFFDILCCLIFCMVLYDGKFRKKLIWVLVIDLLGMLAETITGYIFMFAELEFSQTKILGSFISKIIMLMILVGLKVFNYSRLKRDIPLTYWCIVFTIPLGSIFVLNTLFSLYQRSNDKRITISALLSSAFIMAVNFIVFHVYEKLSDRLEIQKQQIIFDKQIELCRNQIRERGIKFKHKKH